MAKTFSPIAWMAPATLIFVFMMGCAFSDQAAFKQRVQEMSDNELISAYQDITEQLKTINREIRLDRRATDSRRRNDPTPDTNAYFSSGYVDLRAKETILVQEVKKRQLRR